MLRFGSFIFLLFWTLLNSYAQSPQWKWAKSGQSGGDDRSYGVSTDAAGNVYVTGDYSNTTSLTIGSVVLNNAGQSDAFLAKFDSAGNVIWARGAGGALNDEGLAVTSDAQCNIYAVGAFFSSSITFGSSTLSNTGSTDVYVVKHDSSGNVLWAKGAVGANDDAPFSVTTDVSGNVLVAGWFQSPTLTFGSTVLTCNGLGGDMFVVKFDASGNVLWAKNAGGNFQSEARSVSSDPSGNIYVTGYFYSSTISFGSTTLTNASWGRPDIFIVKYSSSGNVIWAKRAGGFYDEMGFGVSTDQAGNCYMSGFYADTNITFGNITAKGYGNCSMFIVKYDPSGNPLWVNSAGGANYNTASAIKTDAAGNSVVAGYFDCPAITFGSTTLTKAGSTQGDIFLVEYDPNGALLWVKGVGGLYDDAPTSLAADPWGNIYMAGYFSSPNLAFGSTVLSNQNTNYADPYVAKLSPYRIPEVKDNGIFVPNVFSPNGDGRNDIFSVLGNNVKDLRLVVYDRWGERVFESADISLGWDGTYKGSSCNTGVYVYYVTGSHLDGVPFVQKGNITLIK